MVLFAFGVSLFRFYRREIRGKGSARLFVSGSVRSVRNARKRRFLDIGVCLESVVFKRVVKWFLRKLYNS